MPFLKAGRNGLKMDETAEDSGRRLRTPAAKARIAIGCVADERQVVRERRRRDTEFLNHPRFVRGDACAAIQLDDACAANALGQVLVWRADDDLIDARVTSG